MSNDATVPRWTDLFGSAPDFTGDVSDLAEFLLARIAEDEAAIHAGPDFMVLGLTAELTRSTDPDDIPVGYHWTGREYGDDLSIYPERALVECAAKRRIIEWTASLEGSLRREGEASDVPLRALALPYADHPDYRQEWRP